MNQNERRLWLIHRLLEEMPQYQYPVFPYTADRQWRLLRSLMNVRPPMPVSGEFLQVQDAFLKEMTERKGIVDAVSLPPCTMDHRLVLWQVAPESALHEVIALIFARILSVSVEELLALFVSLEAHDRAVAELVYDVEL